MRYLSLFSGIEAATQAWQPLGWECVAVSEIEPFPCAVLEHHYPNVPNLGDVTKITEQQIKDLGQIDLIVFGSPCQNLSVAGNRKGFEGEQSSLFYAAMEIIEYAKRHCKTRFALWENVPGAFSSNKGADFTEVVKHMAGLDELNTPTNGWGKEGAAVGSNGLLEWSVLDAQWFGLAQRRKRVFAIVDFGDWTSRPPILLERESLRGDSAPSRETRQDFTADVRASTEGKALAFQQNTRDEVRLMGGNGDIAGALSANLGMKQQNYIYEPPNEPYQQVVGALCARDCKGVGNQYVAEGKLVVEKAVYSFDSLASNSMKSKNPHSGCRQVELAKCLDTSNGCPSKNQGGLAVVAIAGNIIGRTEGNGGNGNGFDESGACYTLTTNDRHAVAYGCTPTTLDPNKVNAITASYGLGGADLETKPLVMQLMDKSYSFDSANMGLSLNKEVAATLCAHNSKQPQNVLRANYVVRRLTPIECERLQGFPDNWTKIPYRNKSADDCPNGVRYKALGNSMAVNVMAWIGQKIQQTQGVKVYGAKTL